MTWFSSIDYYIISRLCVCALPMPGTPQRLMSSEARASGMQYLFITQNNILCIVHQFLLLFFAIYLLATVPNCRLVSTTEQLTLEYRVLESRTEETRTYARYFGELFIFQCDTFFNFNNN